MGKKYNKYEITDIPHPDYPFLHRIRALRDIGDVKAGDLGGFVENSGNLSYQKNDDAWIYDDAIAAGDSFVDQGARLRDHAILCGSAYASQEAEVSGYARAEDHAYLRGKGTVLSGRACASGNSVILTSRTTGESPVVDGSAFVYGIVMGKLHITGNAVILSGERLDNDSADLFEFNGAVRSVSRTAERELLKPQTPEKAERKPRGRGRER